MKLQLSYLSALVLVLCLAGCARDIDNLYDFDSDGSLDENDCVPTDPEIYPGAPDVYGDDLDSNCDGADGNDSDGDGYPGNAPTDSPERDCNDSNASWYPGAPDQVDEDGADSNCDGTDGVDDDGDGWPSQASGGNDCDDNDASLTQSEDIDLDGITDCDGDCLDTDASVHPGAEELCDGRDSDCDGTIPDEEVDGDGDGSLACDDCDDADPLLERLDTDGDGITTCAGDCNDEAAPVNPFQPDLFGDGLDTNCDGIDGIDADGDGFAGTSSGGEDCEDNDPLVTPETDADADGTTLCEGDCDDLDPTQYPDDNDFDGFSPCDGDCDDGDADNRPGGTEICDGQDNDCNNLTSAEGLETDVDGDGFWSCEDCDDTDADIHPDALELCTTVGVDDNCNGLVDVDADQDGDGFTTCDNDCNDFSIAYYPGAYDEWGDPAGADTDCDGVDGNDLDQDGYPGDALPGHPDYDCDDYDPLMTPLDADSDDFSLCTGDCDNGDASIYPGAPDIACDGIDSDCTSAADEADEDGDGYLACSPFAGTLGAGLSGGGDCDDGDPTIHPGDGDNDGYTTCGADGIAGSGDEDCDDADPLIFPGAPEACDGIDSDCVVDPDEFDGDGDLYVACDNYTGPALGILGGGDCDNSNSNVIPVDADSDGYVACDGSPNEDCDETDPSIHPGAVEQACDGVDSDCIPDPQEVDEDDDHYLECSPYTGIVSASGLLGGADCDDADPTASGQDNDNDGYSLCGLDGIPWSGDEDCDDDPGTGPNTYPGAVEFACDGIDSDCIPDPNEVDNDTDGFLECDPFTGTLSLSLQGGRDCDDTNAGIFPVDADGDGFIACDDPSNALPDCDELNPLIYPGAVDLFCDGVDSDCGGDAGELDSDGDGYVPCSPYTGSVVGILGGGDCSDFTASRNPGQVELCNGTDDDCDGSIDPAFEVDNDTDSRSECQGDCNDANAEISDLATEICDGLDNDCDCPGDSNSDGTACGVGDDGVDEPQDDDGDGYTPCGGDCDDGDAMLTGADLDGDGFSLCTGDCDDGDGDSFPGNPDWEDPDGGIDGDCSGFFGTDLGSAAVTFVGVAGSQSGNAVAMIDDIDGDGRPEVLIGAAKGDDPGSTNLSGVPCTSEAGQAFLFFSSTIATGGEFQLSQADVILNGPTSDYCSNAHFGHNVSSAGDLDDDGLGDLLISAATQYQSTGSWLFLGSTLAAGGVFPSTFADTIFESPGLDLGLTLKAGDITGDGNVDIVLGHFGANGPIPGTGGILYIIPGTQADDGGTVQLQTEVDLNIYGDSNPPPGLQTCLADIDGDGRQDIIVGGEQNLVRIFLGSSLAAGGDIPSSQYDIEIRNPPGDWTDYMGDSCASPGDIDGDGRDELLLGSWYSNKIWMFLGSTLSSAGGSVTTCSDLSLPCFGAAEDAYAIWTGDPVGELPGRGLAAAGDVDGDGRGDILVGAPFGDIELFNNVTLPDTGKVYLLTGETMFLTGTTMPLGSTTLVQAADAVFLGSGSPNPSGWFVGDELGWSQDQTGHRLAGGDVNGDTRADLLIGNPGNDDAGTNAGKTYLLFSPY